MAWAAASERVVRSVLTLFLDGLYCCERLLTKGQVARHRSLNLLQAGGS